jgi:hypothetical protein
VWKRSHYAIVEAVEPFKLHHTSISYINYLFEHLTSIQTFIILSVLINCKALRELILSYCCLTPRGPHIDGRLGLSVFTIYGMGIWQHTHTITTTEVSPDLGEFAEIIDDVSVVMISLKNQ